MKRREKPTDTCTRHIMAGNGTEKTEQSVLHLPVRARARRPEDPGEGIGFLVAADTPISQLMTRDVLCVREDMSVEAVRLLFLERGIGIAPVLDQRGGPVGVITKTDLVRSLDELEPPVDDGATLPYGFHLEPVPRAVVRELMTPFVFTLPLKASVAEAAAFMASRSIHHAVVVDGSGTVVGIFTSLDLARWVAVQTGFVAGRQPD